MDITVVLFGSVFVGIWFRARVVDSTRAFSLSRLLLEAGGFFLGFSIAHDAAGHFLGYPEQPFLRYWAFLAFSATLIGRRFFDSWRLRRSSVEERR